MFAVVLVTGHVGSGKTFLVNRLASEVPSNVGVGYISHRFVQEFGTTPTLPEPLHSRVMGPSSDKGYSAVFDFGSGCACCSPQGDFQRALNELTGKLRRPSVIFVETTGLANPSLFIQVLRNPAVGCCLKAVVCVLDEAVALHFLNEPTPANLKNHLEEHVVHSDVLLLQSPNEELALELSKRVDPATKILSRGVVELGELLTDRGVLVADRFFANAASDRGGVFGSGGGFLVPSLTAHDKRFSSVCAVAFSALDVARVPAFKSWLRGLLGAGGALRLKGVVALRGDPTTFAQLFDDDDVDGGDSGGDVDEGDIDDGDSDGDVDGDVDGGSGGGSDGGLDGIEGSEGVEVSSGSCRSALCGRDAAVAMSRNRPTCLAEWWDSEAAPTAVVLVEGSRRGLSWRVVRLSTSQPAHHHRCPNDGTADGASTTAATSSESVAGLTAHCDDSACPLNGPLNSLHVDTRGEGVEETFTGDFDAGHSVRAVAASRSEWRTQNLDHGHDHDHPWLPPPALATNAPSVLRASRRLYSRGVVGVESKVFVLGRSLPVLAPTLRRLLVPEGFRWAADDEVDFARVAAVTVALGVWTRCGRSKKSTGTPSEARVARKAGLSVHLERHRDAPTPERGTPSLPRAAHTASSALAAAGNTAKAWFSASSMMSGSDAEAELGIALGNPSTSLGHRRLRSGLHQVIRLSDGSLYVSAKPVTIFDSEEHCNKDGRDDPVMGFSS